MQPGTFEWALNAMKNGSVVRRRYARDGGGSIAIDFGEFRIRSGDKSFIWAKSTTDILATDWEIVERER